MKPKVGLKGSFSYGGRGVDSSFGCEDTGVDSMSDDCLRSLALTKTNCHMQR